MQVVTLVTAGRFNAPYETYAHAAVGAEAGLSEDQIATSCAGETPADLDTESALAAQVARTLLKGGVVPAPLFKRSVEGPGLDGYNHVVFLTAQYCLVSMTLNPFDVPPKHSALTQCRVASRGELISVSMNGDRAATEDRVLVQGFG